MLVNEGDGEYPTNLLTDKQIKKITMTF